MVMLTDPDLIKKNLKKYWITKGNITISPAGVVNCTGNVNFLPKREVAALPFAWGKVDGDFDVSLVNLQSLQGCPSQVGQNFDATQNRLRSLEHGPLRVGKAYKVWGNDLLSLEGMPDHCQEFSFRYDTHLPLLQTLKAKKIRPLGMGNQRFICQQIGVILNKYAGTNNSADILKCASELNEAGFEANAEW
jgi:hypothetical protein